MSQPQSPRPFSTLGLKPFLWVSNDDFRQIQKKYFDLSRQFHPDRMGHLSENERQILEATSSKINLDYSKLKDPVKLAESVVTGLNIGAQNVNLGSKASSMPPALAAEYFELQELWEEKGLDNPISQTQAQNFHSKILGLKNEIQEKVIEFTKRFPFQGFGNSEAPWSNEDLKALNQMLQQLRYINSFIKDFESRFSSHAHTN